MAHGVDVRPGAMHRRVDGPAGLVGRAPEPVARQDAAVQRGGGVGRVGEQEQIRHAQQPEVHGQRVRPEEGGEFGVPHGDVPAHAEGVAAAGPVPEEGGGVGEGPEAVGGEGRGCGDAWWGFLVGGLGWEMRVGREADRGECRRSILLGEGSPIGVLGRLVFCLS